MTPEIFDRLPGSVWARRIYDVLPDVHECPVNCLGGSKAMRWRPPYEGEHPATYFPRDSWINWTNGYPRIPDRDHDFSLGPEYPGSLPTS